MVLQNDNYLNMFLTLKILLNKEKGVLLKSFGDLMTREPATEASVNDSRNYNGPKVAKFLIG